MKKLFGVKITGAQGIIAAICFIVAFVISLQIRSVFENVGNVPLQARADMLALELVEERKRSDGFFEQAQEFKQLIEKYEAEMAAGSAESAALVEKLRKAEIAAGLADVKGEGVIVRVNDSARSSAHIVHDSDLRLIVNELKNAGAEAISINGERLIHNSSIRCVGNNILINNQTKVPIFEIRVIGDGAVIEGALKLPGGLLDTPTGMFLDISIERVSELTVPRYAYPIDYKFAELSPAEEVER